MESPAADDLMLRAVPALRMMLLSCLVGLPILGILLPVAGFVGEAVAIWGAVVMFALLYVLLRRGNSRAVFFGLVLTLLAYGVAATVIYGSIRGSNIYAFVGAVVVGGIFFGRGALVVTVAACVTCVGALIFAENAGWLGAHPDVSVGLMQWINHSVVLILIAVNIRFAHSLAASALAESRSELAERRIVERALGRSEELFNAFFRNSPAALVITRVEDGTIIDINDAYERIFEVGKVEFVGNAPSADAVWPTPEARAEFIASVARDGRVTNQRVRFRRMGGKEFEAIVSSEALEWRGTRHLFSTITDVSAEAGIRVALQRSEGRLQTIFRESPIAIVLTDFDQSRVVDMNLAAEQLFGVARGAGNGRRTQSSFTDSGVFASARAAMEATGRLSNFHVLLKRPDSGEPLHVVLSSTIVTEGGQRLAINQLVDISGELQARTALAAANAGLEARVRERTAQLEVSNRELEAFSYSVSHDLRSPLRAIDGFLGMLEENLRERMDDDDRELMRRVTAGCSRMDALIADLLDLSRIGRMEVRRQSVDLSGIADSVCALLAQQQPERQVRVDIEPGLNAECDPALARILLDNLLGNAWKFTGRKEGAVIEFGAQQIDGEQVFFVRDNGAGFDMKYAQKLFSAFQRMHRQDEYPGSGIGLVTVQRIVSRHGGRVWAEAESGRGATFRFTLGKPD